MIALHGQNNNCKEIEICFHILKTIQCCGAVFFCLSRSRKKLRFQFRLRQISKRNIFMNSIFIQNMFS